MQQFSRKGFIQTLTLGGGSLLAPGLVRQAQAATSSAGKSSATLKNNVFSLELRRGEKGLRAHVVHLPSKTVLADGPYVYDFGPLALAVVSSDDSSVTVKGTTDTGLELVHIFRLPAGQEWLEEEISIKNATAQQMSGTFRCGFVLPVKPGTLKDYVFTAVPFRREPRDGSHRYQDFSLADILTQKRRSSLREDSSPARLYQDYFSEGWAATDGNNGFLVTKYNQTAREFSVLDRVPAPGGLTGLRWGGAGSDPQSCEGFTDIPAGGTHSFGASRLTAFQGGLTEGFYAFRREMDSRGMGVPANYNPPVHWNELYDNKLWWLPNNGQDNVENRKQYYTRDLILREAAKAKAIGCEALYCDPGWDTNFASKIWDESRMGKLTDFVATLANDYGLKLSLHTPLSGWCNPSSYPPECFRMNKDGHRNGALCGASRQYVDETVKRLNVLGDAGVSYFMFDGTGWNGNDPCWDPSHGHPLPLTCSAHVDATNLIACKVHEKHPQISIEMHDQVMGGAPYRYVPLYYGYGKNVLGTSPASGFDTVWAFEMMWEPMSNLRSGQTILLYYYNLAYTLPLYLHIDLRGDNANAVVFWWNASTIRYLGIGGTHADAAVNTAHAAAMKDYMRLKPFFTAGQIYGIAESVHVHRHPTENAAVMNIFNVGAELPPKIVFEPAKFGLKADKSYKFSVGNFTKEGGAYVSTTLPPDMGHTLVEVTEA